MPIPSIQPAAGTAIMVALSGGVDSATTAWLLKQQGYNVAALFMKNWEEDDPDGACSAEQDAADAEAVADQLGIPFYARNLATEYWESVFAHFLQELRAGRTPNPDILCNREIKFKAMVEHAHDLGYTWIATGHYARHAQSDDGQHQLLKGVDANKDQSYFLHALDQQQLAHALFPLGDYNKAEVRELARQANLKVAAKKDSTGICFIGEQRFEPFIDRYLKAVPGEIHTPEGECIGQHTGLIHYTLGQRRGLRIGGLKHHPEAPWFVAHKDLDNNRLFVVQDTHHPWLMSTALETEAPHWIADQAPSTARLLTARIRYRQADQACRIQHLDEHGMTVSFEQPQRAVTPGQSIVLYDGELCLGGAVIRCGNAPHPPTQAVS